MWDIETETGSSPGPLRDEGIVMPCHMHGYRDHVNRDIPPLSQSSLNNGVREWPYPVVLGEPLLRPAYETGL